MKAIWNIIKKRIVKRKWRKKNVHNKTTISYVINCDNIEVGRGTYGELNVLNHNPECKVVIGSYCSIAPEVVFIPGSDHRTKTISSYPFKVQVLGQVTEALTKGDIIIGDDVWIGYGATVLSGVHIGQGAVVGARAVVTKDVPPYAIVGGIPAKVIKYRFNQKMIEELLKVDFTRLTDEEIEQHIDVLYSELKDEKMLDWMPRKWE